MTLPNGFTTDVITLLSIDEESGGTPLSLALSAMTDAEAAAALRETLISTLAPCMVKLPPFVQQVVARAVMEEVDWPAVAVRFKCPPECN